MSPSELTSLTRPFRSAALAAVMLAPALQSTSVAGVIAYYPFDNDLTSDAGPNGITLTPDGASGGALTLAQTGIFGGAVNFPAVANASSNRSLVTSNSLLAGSHTTFSGSIWAFANPASNAIGWTGGGSDRFFFGNRTNSGSGGWAIFLNKDNPSTIRCLNNPDGPTTPTLISTNNALGAVLNDVYHHVVLTYDAANGGVLKIYFDGVFQNSRSYGADVPMVGTNTNFSIGNEGDQRNANSARSWSGRLDDALFRDDVLTDTQIALLHGLGRHAKVAAGALNEAGTATQIEDAYAAFQAQGQVEAGGELWRYIAGAELNQGSTVGRIGGSVIGGNAYIVLAANGDGLQMLPRPKLTSTSYDMATGQTSLTWNSITGITYDVQYSKDLIAWSDLASAVPATGASTSFIGTVPAEAIGTGEIFFRIKRH